VSPFWSNPRAIPVRTDGDRPVAFAWDRLHHRVTHVADHWRVHTNWWEGDEVWRDYWQVTTDQRYFCVLYHDLINDRWHLERILE